MSRQFNTGTIPGKRVKKRYVVIGTIVALLLFRKLFSVVSVNFFLFIEKLLKPGSTEEAIIAWAALGIPLGLLAGTLVAWKKYKLQFWLNFIPAGVLLLTMLVLFLVNKPGEKTLVKRTVETEAFQWGRFIASSTMPAANGNTYGPDNLMDGSYRTAWIENKINAGLGENVSFTFTTSSRSMENLQCIGFKFLNGYAKSEKLWREHNRVKEMLLSLNGIPIGTYTLQDRYRDMLSVRIDAFQVKDGDVLSFSIKSVYYGSKKADKTALTALVPVLSYDVYEEKTGY
ncbi:MAG: NADase-type glycan-binding domain-containing protein [Chitinophagaceae bacterium]